jgi:hypothetical protein
MSSRFGAAFGAILALVLLALFAWSTLSWILQIVAADGGAIAKGTGYVYVLTTVAGLVSALVIAQLSVTKPGSTPGIGGLNPESTAGIYVTNTIVSIYLIVWVLTGLSALIVGVMLYPENNKTISDLGTTWLGLAVSAAYAYFGISPAGSDKSAEDAKKKALSTATTAASSVGDQLKQKIDAGHTDHREAAVPGARAVEDLAEADPDQRSGAHIGRLPPRCRPSGRHWQRGDREGPSSPGGHQGRPTRHRRDHFRCRGCG